MPVRLDQRNRVLRWHLIQPVPEKLTGVETEGLSIAGRQDRGAPIRSLIGRDRDNPARAPGGSHPALSGHVRYQPRLEVVRMGRLLAKREPARAHGAMADMPDMLPTPIRALAPR